MLIPKDGSLAMFPTKLTEHIHSCILEVYGIEDQSVSEFERYSYDAW